MKEQYCDIDTLINRCAFGTTKEKRGYYAAAVKERFNEINDLLSIYKELFKGTEVDISDKIIFKLH